MDDNYKTPLIEKAIEMAARNHILAGDAIFHSDRGSNYTSQQFAKSLEARPTAVRRPHGDLLR